MDRKKLKTMILLTDMESPDPETLKAIEERIAPRRDIVLNTVGIGEANDEFLFKAASLSGGAYIRVKDINGLATVLRTYAHEPTWQKCPGCGKKMLYIFKHRSWYCAPCDKYRQEF